MQPDGRGNRPIRCVVAPTIVVCEIIFAFTQATAIMRLRLAMAAEHDQPSGTVGEEIPEYTVIVSMNVATSVFIG